MQEYEEEGISGRKKNRPALARLLVDLENNGVRYLIIEKLDRLARDLMVQEKIIGDLQKAGIKVISVHEGEDLASDDPTRKLLRVFMGAITEYDKTMLVQKLKAAKEAKKKATGKCEGRKAYGEESAEEQKIIKRIPYMRRRHKTTKEHRSYQEIADILNAEGILTKLGKEWTPTQIWNIVNSKRRK